MIPSRHWTAIPRAEWSVGLATTRFAPSPAERWEIYISILHNLIADTVSVRYITSIFFVQYSYWYFQSKQRFFCMFLLLLNYSNNKCKRHLINCFGWQVFIADRFDLARLDSWLFTPHFHQLFPITYSYKNHNHDGLTRIEFGDDFEQVMQF